jgi:predicted RNase H-like HicB family nuclease
MRFFVRIYRYKGDYSAMVPDLPGCVAAAESIEKVRKLITEAIVLHLDAMRKSGEPIPKPRRKMEFAIEEEAGEEFCTWVEIPVRQIARLMKPVRARA